MKKKRGKKDNDLLKAILIVIGIIAIGAISTCIYVKTKDKDIQLFPMFQKEPKPDPTLTSFLTSGFITRDYYEDSINSEDMIASGYVFTKEGHYYYQSEFDYNYNYRSTNDEELLISEIGDWKIDSESGYLVLRATSREIIKDGKHQVRKLIDSALYDKRLSVFDIEDDKLYFVSNSSDNFFFYQWMADENYLVSYKDKKHYDIKKMQKIANKGYNDKSSHEILGYDIYMVVKEILLKLKQMNLIPHIMRYLRLIIKIII